MALFDLGLADIELAGLAVMIGEALRPSSRTFGTVSSTGNELESELRDFARTTCFGAGT